MSPNGKFYNTWFDKGIVAARRELADARHAVAVAERKVRKLIRDHLRSLPDSEGLDVQRTTVPDLIQSLDQIERISWKDFVQTLKPVHARQESRLKAKLGELKCKPDICWYPISGIDFGPLHLDSVTDFTGQRFLSASSLVSESGVTLLWLNDSSPDLLLWLNDSSPDLLRSRIPQQSCPRYLDISEHRFASYLRGLGKGAGEEGAAHLLAAAEESYLFNGKSPLTLLSVSPFGSNDFEGARIVVFSNVSSAELFRELIYPLRLRVKSVYLGRSNALVPFADRVLERETFGLEQAAGYPHESRFLLNEIRARRYDGLDRLRDIPGLLLKCQAELGLVDYYFLDQDAYHTEKKTPSHAAIRHYQHITNVAGISRSVVGLFARPGAVDSSP